MFLFEKLLWINNLIFPATKYLVKKRITGQKSISLVCPSPFSVYVTLFQRSPDFTAFINWNTQFKSNPLGDNRTDLILFQRRAPGSNLFISLTQTSRPFPLPPVSFEAQSDFICTIVIQRAEHVFHEKQEN